MRWQDRHNFHSRRSATISIIAGQTFGFRVYTNDNRCGSASVVVSSFDVVPEPATLGLLVFGAMTLLQRKRK
ncbi:MAG: PEP-CTERM sorting domain-containing protein [Phycisphaerae bacterium]|nr:PEP-CTERM sorting domain-containing protein [Phycisphaerae bacterium]